MYIFDMSDDDVTRYTDWTFCISAYSFDCDNGNIDLANEAYSPVNDAFYYANAVYDMYTEEYGIPPLKGKIVARWIIEQAETLCTFFKHDIILYLSYKKTKGNRV